MVHVTVTLHERYGVSDHQWLDSLFNMSTRRIVFGLLWWPLIDLTTTCADQQNKKHQSSTSMALCEGNPSWISGFSPLWGTNAESVSMQWRHHEWGGPWDGWRKAFKDGCHGSDRRAVGHCFTRHPPRVKHDNYSRSYISLPNCLPGRTRRTGRGFGKI